MILQKDKKIGFSREISLRSSKLCIPSVKRFDLKKIQRLFIRRIISVESISEQSRLHKSQLKFTRA